MQVPAVEDALASCLERDARSRRTLLPVSSRMLDQLSHMGIMKKDARVIQTIGETNIGSWWHFELLVPQKLELFVDSLVSAMECAVRMQQRAFVALGRLGKLRWKKWLDVRARAKAGSTAFPGSCRVSIALLQRTTMYK